MIYCNLKTNLWKTYLLVLNWKVLTNQLRRYRLLFYKTKFFPFFSSSAWLGIFLLSIFSCLVLFHYKKVMSSILIVVLNSVLSFRKQQHGRMIIRCYLIKCSIVLSDLIIIAISFHTVMCNSDIL